MTPAACRKKNAFLKTADTANLKTAGTRMSGSGHLHLNQIKQAKKRMPGMSISIKAEFTITVRNLNFM